MKKVWNVVVRFIEHKKNCNRSIYQTRSGGRLMNQATTDQRGATLIMVAVSMVVICGFAVLAIDVSMMLLAKTQLHNAADSAALAGASVLAVNKDDTQGARDKAIEFAGLNMAVQNGMSPVVITGDWISFSENNTRITVTTHRTIDTKDPVSLFFLRTINSVSNNKGDVTATASAKVMGVCSSDCLKPFAVPDKWYDAKHDSIFNPKDGDYYDRNSTGYQSLTDVGKQITIKFGNPKTQKKWPAPGLFLPINFTTISDDAQPGKKEYEKWISECEPWMVNIGDSLVWEPGVAVGPTEHGLDDLIKMDPHAQWDPNGDTVMYSEYAVSPRIIKIAFFDPSITFDPGRGYVVVIKIGVVFLEKVTVVCGCNDIIGRFMKVVSHGEICDDIGSFMYKVALVQ
jgi:Flp pilus assembly protein TadG